MKRMYRIAALLLLLVLLLGITAQADMIVTTAKYMNNFFEFHRDECKFYGRTHYINAPEGALGVYRKPNGKEVMGTLKNAEEVFVGYTYDEGAWGLIQFSVPGGATGGWIRMDQTVLKYDSYSFIHDHSHLFYPDDGTAVQMLEGTLSPYTYPYPGAAAPVGSVQTEHLLEGNYSFEYLYKDENELIWGYLGNSKYGDRWVCLSEPVNNNLPVVEYQTLNLYPASDIVIESEPIPAWILPTCLVVAVAAISGVLLVVLKRRKAKGA